MKEKTKKKHTKVRELVNFSVYNDYKILELQDEIGKLKETITALEAQLEGDEEPLSIIGNIKGLFKREISPWRFIINLLVKFKNNIQDNFQAYLISTLLAGIIASGIDIMLKAKSFDEFSEKIKEDSLKQIQSSIDSNTQAIQKRLQAVEIASEKLKITQNKLEEKNKPPADAPVNATEQKNQ